MEGFKAKEYKIFELFDKQWAIVTAGSMAHYNSCTVSWGSLGNIWGHAGHSCPIVTVYVHPARYTSEFLRDSDIFTVSFYPENCRKALSYIGSHSGRDGDKIAAAGLTPVTMGQGVTFREANLTFLCKKLYQHQFSRDNLAPEIQAYYAAAPQVYPDFQGGWQPHIVFVGEITDVRDERWGGKPENLPAYSRKAAISGFSAICRGQRKQSGMEVAI